VMEAYDSYRSWSALVQWWLCCASVFKDATGVHCRCRPYPQPSPLVSVFPIQLSLLTKVSHIQTPPYPIFSLSVCHLITFSRRMRELCGKYTHPLVHHTSPHLPCLGHACFRLSVSFYFFLAVCTTSVDGHANNPCTDNMAHTIGDTVFHAEVNYTASTITLLYSDASSLNRPDNVEVLSQARPNGHVNFHARADASTVDLWKMKIGRGLATFLRLPSGEHFSLYTCTSQGCADK
jgi:hypothetical protein